MFVKPAQKELFRKIEINSEKKVRRFLEALWSHPELGGFVKDLDFTGPGWEIIWNIGAKDNLRELISRCSSLTRLSVERHFVTLDFQLLVQAKMLKFLYLKKTNLESSSSRSFTFQNLKYLHLESVAIDEKIDALKSDSLPSLTTLYMHDVRAWKKLKTIGFFHQIINLSINQRNLPQYLAEDKFFEMFTSLKTIEFFGNIDITALILVLSLIPSSLSAILLGRWGFQLQGSWKSFIELLKAGQTYSILNLEEISFAAGTVQNREELYPFSNLKKQGIKITAVSTEENYEDLLRRVERFSGFDIKGTEYL